MGDLNTAHDENKKRHSVCVCVCVSDLEEQVWVDEQERFFPVGVIVLTTCRWCREEATA